MHKFFKIAPAVLALMAFSSLALANVLSNPPRDYKIEYNYYKEGKLVGGETYHCNGGFTKWGSVTDKGAISVTPC